MHALSQRESSNRGLDRPRLESFWSVRLPGSEGGDELAVRSVGAQGANHVNVRNTTRRPPQRRGYLTDRQAEHARQSGLA